MTMTNKTSEVTDTHDGSAFAFTMVALPSETSVDCMTSWGGPFVCEIKKQADLECITFFGRECRWPCNTDFCR